jgi:hypothetical protein
MHKQNITCSLYFYLLLMIKFGKAKKTGLSSFLNQNIRFWQFWNMIKKESKYEDLKIQECLNHE